MWPPTMTSFAKCRRRNKLLERLLKPGVIASLALLLAVVGILAGKALDVSGSGISISPLSPESRINEAAVETTIEYLMDDTGQPPGETPVYDAEQPKGTD